MRMIAAVEFLRVLSMITQTVFVFFFGLNFCFLLFILFPFTFTSFFFGNPLLLVDIID